MAVRMRNKTNPMEKAEKEIGANLPEGMKGEDTEDIADAPPKGDSVLPSDESGKE